MWLPGSWRVLVWRIERAIKSGDLERAAQISARFAGRRPKVAQGWWFWGDLLLRLGRPDEAAEVLRRGARANPEASELAYLLARALNRQGRLEEAREVLNRETVRNPAATEPYLGLLELAVYAGSWKEARGLVDEVSRRMSPEKPWVAYELALRAVEVPGCWDLAKELLMAVSEAWPRDASAHALLGLMLESEGPEGARKHLAIARRNWKSRSEFDEYLNSRTSLLATIARRSSGTRGDASENRA
jgi:tetratricopeptide (TPR) repeat protein